MNIKKKIMSAKGETLNREVHPNWYIDIPGMKTLILGSYPPHEDKRHFEFFYPNKINRFWKILAEINGSALQYFENEKAVEERIAIMNSLKVGVQNLGKVILRKGKSARDLDIQILEFQDILNIISRNPNLERVLLPGISGPSSTYYLFLKYLKLNHIDIG
ncbi:MAG: hypothetical protein KDD50_15215, partial [Bdellovibrionales bacterium]|nr:hypothetical protein [Bdellovibrionales bacterium]